MASNRLTPTAIRAQMERILDSRDFQASARLKNFFRFLVEETLSGHAARLKGYTIATTVFGRPDNFDAQTDPIVRVEAAKLRSRLEHYYYTHHTPGSVYIELPKGRYIPEFSIIAPEERQTASGIAPEPPPQSQALEPRCVGIAVLPFTFPSDGDRTDYFSDGLAEEITVNLTKFDDLSVASSYSTRRPG